MQSLWALSQQDEFVYISYYQNSIHIPKLIGTCGHMYGVEYLHTELTESSSDISHLAYITRIVLQSLRHFQHDFTETMHLCDLKGLYLV